MVKRAACIVLLALVAGCGGDDSEEEQPPTLRETVLEYFAAQNDSKRRCQLLSEATRIRYGGGPNGPGCVKQFVGGGLKPPEIAILETAKEGKRGCARFLTKPDGGEGIAILVMEGTWKVDAFEIAVEPRSPIGRACRDDAAREAD